MSVLWRLAGVRNPVRNQCPETFGTSPSGRRWAGLPRGRPAKLSPAQVALARARYEARDITVAEIARALRVGRGTIYRALQQAS